MARYIDADKLRNSFPAPEDWTDPDGALFHITGVWAIIDEQPTADVRENVKGKWIVVDDAYNRISGKCSACGWKAHLYEDDVVGMPYCPNCGANMEETE